MIPQILSELHKHPADKYICRDDASHTYSIKLPEDTNDVNLPELVSVTQLTEKYFKPFDAVRVSHLVSSTCRNIVGHRYEGMSAQDLQKQWAVNGDDARMEGHRLHRAIELYYNPDTYVDNDDRETINYVQQRPEYQQFEQFWADFQSSRSLEKDAAVPYRTEWIIYDRSARVAGTVDMLYQNASDNTYTLVDWKRIKKLDRTGRDKGIGILSKYPNCNLTKYTFQLNVYRYILENVYGLKIRNAFLVAMHPTRETYHVEPISKEPFTSEVVHRLFQSLRATHVLRWSLSQNSKHNSCSNKADVRVKRDSED